MGNVDHPPTPADRLRRTEDRRHARLMLGSAAIIIGIAVFLMPDEPVTRAGILLCAAGILYGGVEMHRHAGRIKPRAALYRICVLIGCGLIVGLIGLVMRG